MLAQQFSDFLMKIPGKMAKLEVTKRLKKMEG
jgi:hypothetical protein